MPKESNSNKQFIFISHPNSSINIHWKARAIRGPSGAESEWAREGWQGATAAGTGTGSDREQRQRQRRWETDWRRHGEQNGEWRCVSVNETWPCQQLRFLTYETIISSTKPLRVPFFNGHRAVHLCLCVRTTARLCACLWSWDPKEWILPPPIGFLSTRCQFAILSPPPASLRRHKSVKRAEFQTGAKF